MPRLADQLIPDRVHQAIFVLDFTYRREAGGRYTDVTDGSAWTLFIGLASAWCGGEEPAATDAAAGDVVRYERLAGAERDFPAKQHLEAFYKILNANMSCTVHAGEGRPPGEIRVAIEQLLARRIGHGTTILQDPTVVELALELRLIDDARHTPVRTRAEALAVKTVEALRGVGVFGIEMFLTADGALLVNEVAPRTHNSGHHTIEACVTDQFEQHLRAILGL